MKVTVDTRIVSDCHCEKCGFFSVKGKHSHTQCEVDHEAVYLQFAPVHNVKLLVSEKNRGTDIRLLKDFVHKHWEERSSICL